MKRAMIISFVVFLFWSAVDPTFGYNNRTVTVEITGSRKVTMPIPKDRDYTFQSRVSVRGTVDADVSLLQAGDKRINLSENLSFKDELPLNIGKNSIIFKVKDATGKEYQFERRMLRVFIPPGMSISDVENKPLDYQLAATLIAYYTEREYRYTDKLTRAQLAVLIAEAKSYKIPILFERVSDDISRSHWAARSIKAVLDNGAMSLYDDNTFRPNFFVSRSELIKTLSHASGYSTDHLKKFLLSDDLNGESSMGDALSVMYQAGMFRDGINDYLAFLGMAEMMAEAAPEAPATVGTVFNVTEPQDKLVTFNNVIHFSGTVSRDAARVTVKGEQAVISGGKFKKQVMLNYGKNKVAVEEQLREGGSSTISIRLFIVEMPPGVVFSDKQKLEAADPEYKTSLYIMKETLGQSFDLKSNVKRGDFCRIVYAAKGLTSTGLTKDVAKDVPMGHRYAKEINAILRTGALVVYPDGTFKPDEKMTRSELLEAVAVLQGVDLATASEFFGGEKDLSQSAEMDDMVQFCWRSGIFKGRISEALAWDSY